MGGATEGSCNEPEGFDAGCDAGCDAGGGAGVSFTGEYGVFGGVSDIAVDGGGGGVGEDTP